MVDAASVSVAPIREEARYGGVRTELRATLDAACVTLQVDVGSGEVVTPAPQSATYPSLLPNERCSLQRALFGTLEADRKRDTRRLREFASLQYASSPIRSDVHKPGHGVAVCIGRYLEPLIKPVEQQPRLQADSMRAAQSACAVHQPTVPTILPRGYRARSSDQSPHVVRPPSLGALRRVLLSHLPAKDDACALLPRESSLSCP